MRRLQLGRKVRRVRLVGGRGSYVAVADHRVQDVALPALGVGGALGQKRVEIARALRQARQEGGLRQIEAARGGAEVRLRGRLHPKRLVAVEDRVEIHLENLILGVLPLQLNAADELARLAVETAAGRVQ